MSVGPTVVVRVTVDWSQQLSLHKQTCELCVFTFFASSVACSLCGVKWPMWWQSMLSWFCCDVVTCAVSSMTKVHVSSNHTDRDLESVLSETKKSKAPEDDGLCVWCSCLCVRVCFGVLVLLCLFTCFELCVLSDRKKGLLHSPHVDSVLSLCQ